MVEHLTERAAAAEAVAAEMDEGGGTVRRGGAAAGERRAPDRARRRRRGMGAGGGRAPVLQSVRSNTLFEQATWMDLAEIGATLERLAGVRHNRRHKPSRAFEHASYRFEVTCDYGAFRETSSDATRVPGSRRPFDCPGYPTDTGDAPWIRTGDDRFA